MKSGPIFLGEPEDNEEKVETPSKTVGDRILNSVGILLGVLILVLLIVLTAWGIVAVIIEVAELMAK
jgi:hypothetical protein